MNELRQSHNLAIQFMNDINNNNKNIRDHLSHKKPNKRMKLKCNFKTTFFPDIL